MKISWNLGITSYQEIAHSIKSAKTIAKENSKTTSPSYIIVTSGYVKTGVLHLHLQKFHDNKRKR